jgi:hypothetical protein
MTLNRVLITTIALALAFGSIAAQAEDIKAGMIGLDTSHVTAFTSLLNDATNPKHIPGVKVVAAFTGGSDDIKSSYTRTEKFTTELRDKYGVKIYDTIEEMLTHVDVVLLESVDGRPHLEQVKPVFAAKKPVFIDKPLAGSLSDALEIDRLAKEAGVPWFSSSSYRYYDSLKNVMKEDIGELKGAISWGPCSKEPHHPDLFWYGVHATEALFTVMGQGCETVTRTATEDTDVVTGVWKDGRVGTLRGLRNMSTPHQVVLFGTKKVAIQESSGDYAGLVVEIVKFFKTGVVPIPPEETIEMFAFMEAADESKRQGGIPVAIADVIEKARKGK